MRVAMKKGTVFDIQRYSIHDGPGIRTIVFLKGCPLRCEWCANPESQNPMPELLYNAQDCLGCQRCVIECPSGALSYAGGLQVDRSICTVCGSCAEACPREALSIVGEEMAVEQVITEVDRDILFYRKSNGGLTLSGGEPTSQPDFAIALLRHVYNRGISTAVETCGFCGTDVLREFTNFTDLFLYDIKHVNDEKHLVSTGVSNELILSNVKVLSDAGALIDIRVPVIPDFNNSEEDIADICSFLKRLHFRSVHLLPYHRLGENKAALIGKHRSRFKAQPPDEETMIKLQEVVRDFGFAVQIGG